MQSKVSRGIARIAIAVIVIIVIIVAAAGAFFVLMDQTSSSLSTQSSLSTSSSVTNGLTSSSTSSTSSSTSCYITVSNSSQPTTVNIALEAGIITEPLYVGNASGIFLHNGIKPNFQIFSSDSAVMTAIGAGQEDFAIEIPDVVANSVASGVSVKVLSAVLGNLTGGNAILVRENSSITSVSQLNGKKVAVSAAGSLTDIWARMIERSYGINFTEAYLGQTARAAALLAGQVDAIVSSGPQVFILTSSGQARAILNITESVVPYFSPYAVTIASGSLIQNHPDIVRRLLESVQQSIAYMRANPQQTYPILAKEISAQPAVGPWLYNITVPYFSNNGQLNSTQMLQAAQLQNQLIASQNQVPPISNWYTSEFVPISNPC